MDCCQFVQTPGQRLSLQQGEDSVNQPILLHLISETGQHFFGVLTMNEISLKLFI